MEDQLQQGVSWDKNARIRTRTACLTVASQDVPIFRQLLKPLLRGLIRLADRSGVGDMAEVLMHMFCKNAHAPGFESTNHLVRELDLRGISVGHQGEVVGGEVDEEVR